MTSRLALVAVGDELEVVVPGADAHLEALAALARAAVTATATVTPPVPKHLLILQVLMSRWLVGQGPISRGELGAQAGATYPTTSRALKRLQRDVHARSDRSVELVGLPERAWSELLALSHSLRGTVAYRDASGGRTPPPDLLRRLQRLKPPQVALGGVVGAHHWDPLFDLQGLPRLDLSLHAPDGVADLGFVERLDPALEPTSPDAPGSVLVVHAVRRPASLFAEDPAGGLPFADPVEVLLDLHELRLHEQAGALLDRMMRRNAA
ncbi:MAG: helix-turn-helix domain-containing protein [Planctomycetes bacterium]|nr:helix-turn-helix domain-containing protein [Planctomycetota bacterium]